MNRTRNLAALAIAAGSLAMIACTAPPTPDGPWVAAGCYGSPVADAPDFSYSGTQDTVGNLTVALDLATFTLSDDGTCAGIPLGEPYTFTLVQAADQATAETVCTSLGQTEGAGQIADDYPGFPADAWVCNPAVPA